MRRLFETIENFLERQDMIYHRQSTVPSEPDTLSLAVKFRAKHCRIWCEFFIRENQRSVIVVASGGVSVPEDRRAQVYEFIVRANYGLKWGRWDMDPSTGDVQFVHSFCARASSFLPATVKHLIGVVVSTYDNYHQGLCAVAYGQITPLDAVCQAEGPSPGVSAQVVSQLIGAHNDRGGDRSLEMHEPPAEGKD